MIVRSTLIPGPLQMVPARVEGGWNAVGTLDIPWPNKGPCQTPACTRKARGCRFHRVRDFEPRRPNLPTATEFGGLPPGAGRAPHGSLGWRIHAREREGEPLRASLKVSQRLFPGTAYKAFCLKGSSEWESRCAHWNLSALSAPPAHTITRRSALMNRVPCLLYVCVMCWLLHLFV